MRKKYIFPLLLLTFATIAIIFSLTSIVNTQKTASPMSYTIVIDPGHGGIDKGASGVTTDIAESKINLDISLLLCDILSNQGFNVIMTRYEDVGLYGDTSKGFKKRDMQARKQIAESSQANLLISIHCNKSLSQIPQGVVAYYNDNNPHSKLFAQNLIKSTTTIPNLKTHGQIKTQEFFMTHQIDLPSVIFECGFLSNASEEVLLSTPSYQKQLAKKIAQAILLTLLEN